jgi:hypothetical protein
VFFRTLSANMRRISGICLSLLLLSSCATSPPPAVIVPATDLPAAVNINKDAGRGGMLFVTLRLDDGTEAPFMLDTGAGGTLFNKSLESKLGKRRGTERMTVWGGTGKASYYAAPRLYLGNTRLMTGRNVLIGDLPHQAGILGMDCLQHYCIQLDFAAGKMRFLKPGQVNAAELGTAFPLTFRGNLPFIHHGGLLGKSGTNLLIDMGCRIDGLEEKSAIKGLAQILPDCVWDGATYTDVEIAAVEHANVLGLRFFARHLVTLDFPNRTIYLKQTSIGPPPGDSSMEIANAEMGAPAEFLEGLKENGRLPGLSKADEVAICVEGYANYAPQPVTTNGVAYGRAYFNTRHKSVTFDLLKKGDSSLYRYQVARTSAESPWDLRKAWRTDQTGHTIEEYPTP